MEPLSHIDTNTPPLSLCLAVMDAYLNPQPNSGAGQPPQAGAAEVPSPSQQQQQQQQPAPSGTSDVAGAGAAKHAKTSPVWLYYREVPFVTEGGKNVRCTVSRTIPATGKAPERTVECAHRRVRLGAHLQKANRLPEGLRNKWYAGPAEEEAHESVAGCAKSEQFVRHDQEEAWGDLSC